MMGSAHSAAAAAQAEVRLMRACARPITSPPNLAYKPPSKEHSNLRCVRATR